MTNITLKPSSSEFYDEMTYFRESKSGLKIKETRLKNDNKPYYHEGYPYLKTMNVNNKINKQRLELPFFINTR